MRTAIDQLIDLSKVFTTTVELTKDHNGLYLVTLRYVSYKENRHDMSRSISGRGRSVEFACSDYLTNAKGKLLFGDNRSFYGENRPEYLCV